jgi:hypothetical protein
MSVNSRVSQLAKLDSRCVALSGVIRRLYIESHGMTKSDGYAHSLGSPVDELGMKL